MSVITIVGAGMMGSALAFPARENGNEVRLVGTHLDREIIDTARQTGRHPKFNRDFPAGVSYHQIEELDVALQGAGKLMSSPRAYDIAVRSAGPLSSVLRGKNIGKLPGALPLLPGWTDHRDLPKPGTSFRSWWDQREKDRDAEEEGS